MRGERFVGPAYFKPDERLERKPRDEPVETDVPVHFYRQYDEPPEGMGQGRVPEGWQIFEVSVHRDLVRGSIPEFIMKPFKEFEIFVEYYKTFEGFRQVSFPRFIYYYKDIDVDIVELVKKVFSVR